MVLKHDLTFTYSDDYGVFKAGESQYARIIAFAQTIPREDAVRIWNANADRCLKDGSAYHWKN